MHHSYFQKDFGEMAQMGSLFMNQILLFTSFCQSEVTQKEKDIQGIFFLLTIYRPQ